MDYVLFVAIAVVAGFYVVAPLVLWINGSRITQVQREQLSDNTTVPPRAEAYLLKTTPFFFSNGFEKLGARVQESMPNGLRGYKQIWHHPTTKEVALAGVHLRQGHDEFLQQFVVFIHDRGNGGLLTTSDFVPLARSNMDHPADSKLLVPRESLDGLRAMHRAHVKVAALPQTKPLQAHDNIAVCQMLDDQSRKGALALKHFRHHGDALRITLRGALYGVWINLPPFKKMLEHRDRAFLHRVRAAFNGAAPPPARRAAA